VSSQRPEAGSGVGEGGATAGSVARKAKKREEKSLEHVLKALQSLETTDDKLASLCKKYTELLEEHKAIQNQFKQSQRALSVLSREKDQLQSEHSKAVLAKSKLEGLCRELQRHNKLVKDESIARAKEDDEKRKEVTTKFQTTINDIQTQMNEHYQKNTALREENLELANKLKGLIEQYELREEHIDKVFKSKDIESQLYDARLQQAALQIGEEKERHLHDKQLLMREAMESQKKIMLLEEQEKALKAQVAMYSEKYDDFQSTLTRSNDVFTSFKTEMDKMSKKIKKLERDTTMWRQKWESSQKALITMAEQKARSDKDASLLQNKITKLESLCRALQEERKRSGATPSAPTDGTLTDAQPEGSASLTGSAPLTCSAPLTGSASLPHANGRTTPDGVENDAIATLAVDTAPVDDKTSTGETPGVDITETPDIIDTLVLATPVTEESALSGATPIVATSLIEATAEAAPPLTDESLDAVQLVSGPTEPNEE
jgi:myosin heavy subunit